MMFFILPYKVNAVTYQETNQSTFQYNINNFKLDGDYIIINGWGTTDRHQDLTGDDTHEFSLVLTDKSNNESKSFLTEGNFNSDELPLSDSGVLPPVRNF